MQIGTSRIMVDGDVPNRQGGSNSLPAMFFLYVADTDAVYQAALSAGAKSMMEPDERFQEKRGAAVTDPFGNTWFIATTRD